MNNSTVEGSLHDLNSRSAASMDLGSDPTIIVPMEDAVPADAVHAAAGEIAAELAARLLRAFRYRRRM
jgi:hypothetical protein